MLFPALHAHRYVYRRVFILNRTVPEKVKSQLRQEVNFGCPLPDCGCPLLTWHHFDPPWHIRNHHNPDGMIALCVEHHAMADQGIFSNEQLHAFKSNPNKLNLIRNKFLWFPEASIIRLGGCYANDWCELSLCERPLLEIKRDNDGLTKICFMLFDKHGEIIAAMNKNEFTLIPKNIHDFTVAASSNRIKIWYEKSSIGFELHYSRKNLKQIEAFLADDKKKMMGQIEDKLAAFIMENDIESKENDLDSLYEKLEKIDNINDLIPICYQEGDPTTTIIRWYAVKHIGSDGKIPFINFEKCNLHYKGKNIRIEKGKLVCAGGVNANYCAFNRFNEHGMG